MNMSGFVYNKHAIFLASLLYWACALLLIQSFADNRNEYLQSEQKQEVRREIALVRASLEAKIFEHIYKADSLATVITIDPEFTLKHWEQIAEKLIRQAPYIRNIGVAPDNIIRHVYPLKGNEKALGFDFRTNPKQHASVLKAKALGGVYLDGPLELVQGGQAVIARFPIFRDFPINTLYWGSVSIVLDYEKLLKDTGIQELESVDIAMQRRASQYADPITFYGDAKLFSNADLVLPILLPNTQWTLAGRYNLKSPSVKWVYLLGFGGFVLLYISLLMLIRAYRISHNASLQDELTHLPNRRHIMSYLERATADKTSKDFVLLNIDLNDFKAVNDSFGHETGDQLLKHIAHYLRESVRKNDVVARIGGDEFLVVLEHISYPEEVKAQIDQIKNHLSSHPMTCNGQTITPSLSIGYATFLKNEPQSVEALLHIADQQMYQEKQASKNRAD